MAQNDQLYSQYADIPALEGQTTKILQMFEEVETGMNRLAKFGFKINTGQSVAEVVKLANESDVLGKQLKAQQKQIIEMTAKLGVLDTQEARHAESLRQVIALTKGETAEAIKLQKIRNGEYATLQQQKQANNDLNKSIQLRIQIRNAEEGSIEQLSLKSQKLIGIVSKLSEAQRDSARGQGLVATSEALSKRVNELKKGAGSFKDNIGRYAESLGGLFDNVRNEISKVQQKQQELQSRTKVQGFVTPQQQKEADQFTASLNELNGVLAIGNKEGQTFFQTTKQLQGAFGSLTENGNQSRTFIAGFKTDVAKASNEARELKTEIKLLGSETRGLDLAVGTVNTLAAAFQAGAGAAALFSNDTKDIERVTQKLIAIQSVANGVKQIGEELTKRGTAANKAYNFVLQQGQILFGKGSTAAQRFGAALKGIIILAVIAGIVELVKQLDIFGKSAAEKRDEVDKLNESMQSLYETTKKLTELSAQNPNDNLEIAVLKQKLALQQANGVSLASQFKTKQQIAQKERDLAEKQVQDLLKRGDALDEGVVTEMNSYDQIEKAQQDFYDKTVQANAELQGLRRQRIKGEQTLTEDEKTNYDNAIKDQETYVNLVQGQYDEYTSIINNAIEKQQNLDTLQAEERQRQFEAEKKAALELLKFRKQLIIDQKTFESSDDVPFSARSKVQAAKEAAQAEKDVLDASFKYDIEQKDLAKSAKKKIEEDYAENILNINDKLSNQIIHIYRNEKDERLRLAHESSDDFDRVEQTRVEEKKDRLQKAFDKEQHQLEQFRDESEKNNAENFEKGFKTYSEYAKKKLEIEETYQRLVLESQIRFYKEQRDTLKQSGEDTSEIDAAIAAAEAMLADNRIDSAKKVKDATKVINDEIVQNYRDAARQIEDAFINVFAAISERQKQALQDQMDGIDKRKEAEITAISSSTETEEKKAARIKVIEAKAAADKEQLARRQRQIDRQNAIFERTFKIFQIVTDTIQGVNKIKLQMAAAPIPQKPLYASQITLAIASGIASVTAILAAPLPKFARGGTSQFDQFAEVAEEGAEIGIKPGGKWKVYDRRQIAKLVKGEKILPANLTRNILRSASMDLAINAAMFSNTDGGSQLQDETLQKEMLHELKEFNRRPPLAIHVSENVEATPYYQKQIKH